MRRCVASKQTTEIDYVEHANGDDREIRSVESKHPRERPNFRDKVQVQLNELSYERFHRLGDLTGRAGGSVLKLSENKNAQFSKI